MTRFKPMSFKTFSHIFVLPPIIKKVKILILNKGHTKDIEKSFFGSTVPCQRFLVNFPLKEQALKIFFYFPKHKILTGREGRAAIEPLVGFILTVMNFC